MVGRTNDKYTSKEASAVAFQENLRRLLSAALRMPSVQEASPFTATLMALEIACTDIGSK
jgi:hypothetical protein